MCSISQTYSANCILHFFSTQQFEWQCRSIWRNGIRSQDTYWRGLTVFHRFSIVSGMKWVQNCPSPMCSISRYHFQVPPFIDCIIQNIRAIYGEFGAESFSTPGALAKSYWKKLAPTVREIGESSSAKKRQKLPGPLPVKKIHQLLFHLHCLWFDLVFFLLSVRIF